MAEQEIRFPFNGTPGESLFHQPCISIQHLNGFNSTIPGFLARARQSGDDRSLTVFAALVVEHSMDALLEAWLPAYSGLLKHQEWSFSMRIRTLRAFRIVPPQLVLAADCVRDVRNRFAHDLALDKFAQLLPEQLNKLRIRATDFTHHGETKAEVEARTPRDHFDRVSSSAAAGISMYVRNAQLMREFLARVEVQQQFKSYCDASLSLEMTAGLRDPSGGGPPGSLGREWIKSLRPMINAPGSVVHVSTQFPGETAPSDPTKSP